MLKPRFLGLVVQINTLIQVRGFDAEHSAEVWMLRFLSGNYGKNPRPLGSNFLRGADKGYEPLSVKRINFAWEKYRVSGMVTTSFDGLIAPDITLSTTLADIKDVD
jgi:hypothetical protein